MDHQLHPAQSIAKLDPASDTLFAQYGIGPTHASNNVVERLVEFQLSDAGVTFSGTDPIQLTLLGDDEARNWEGIACLHEHGFCWSQTNRHHPNLRTTAVMVRERP